MNIFGLKIRIQQALLVLLSVLLSVLSVAEASTTVATWQGDKDGAVSITFDDQGSDHGSSSAILNDCIMQLDEYFKGQRKTFDLPLDPEGTDFQHIRCPRSNSICSAAKSGTTGGRLRTADQN